MDDALGRAGQDQPDGARKFSMPRSDLKVTLDGVELKAGFALGSWAAFQKMGSQSAVMGDLVLADSEVGPVMQKLTDSGIEITALHNHLIRSNPPVMYMHIGGHGDALSFAQKVLASDPLRSRLWPLALVPLCKGDNKVHKIKARHSPPCKGGVPPKAARGSLTVPRDKFSPCFLQKASFPANSFHVFCKKLASLQIQSMFFAKSRLPANSVHVFCKKPASLQIQSMFFAGSWLTRKFVPGFLQEAGFPVNSFQVFCRKLAYP